MVAERFAYFQKQIVPLADAKIGVMTHAFNYGTGCFEGIRGNWNEQQEQLFLFRLREHYERLRKSCKILYIDLPYSVDDLIDLTVRLVRRCDFHEDVYVRPLAYKSGEIVAVRLHDIPDDLVIFVTTLGAYLDFTRGIHCGTSSWRRVDDTAIPARAKVTGIYVNSALAKTEANLSGFDEAIMLSDDGHVSEGSGENVFIVDRGRLITPPPSDNILVGITAATVRQIAREEFGIETVERTIDRSELYIADEVFLTGTAAHVSPVAMIDHRRIGDGEIGPISARLQERYFQVARGEVERYKDWVTPALAPSDAPVAGRGG
jgi:branched-chain amino acid aminotransferase